MLGFVTVTEKGRADALLAALAGQLAAAGGPLVAMVREPLPGERACEMHLRLIPEGRVVSISQPLGQGADACTLDAGALELAVEATARAIAAAPEGTAVILNKFGKQEASGRGCRPLIAQALEAGHRVLVSVPPETRAEFDAFAADLAEELAPNARALADFLGVTGPVLSKAF